MPSDDSSPIPIYSLSLMLLKSPTHSANREGTLSGEGEGGGEGWRLEEREVVSNGLGALKPGAEAQWGLCLSRTLVPDLPALLLQGIGPGQLRVGGKWASQL